MAGVAQGGSAESSQNKGRCEVEFRARDEQSNLSKCLHNIFERREIDTKRLEAAFH